MIYPRTLKSDWYTAGVCDSIFESLEKTKFWTANTYKNKPERNAYIEAFEACQKLVKKNDMKPQAMLQALSDFHDDLLALPPYVPLFSRIFYKPNEARETAIKVAFELVDSINKRFLS